jgi:hypothetical protein
MRGRRGNLLRRAAAVVVGGWALANGTGCVSCLNPIPDLPPEATEPCLALPQPCRSQVYVFLIDGFDPLHCGNLPGVRGCLTGLGFIKTYHGYCYHKGYFLKEMLRIHAESPEARFAVVGFDYGAGPARELAADAVRSEVPVDLLVYLGGCGLKDLPADEAPAGRVVNLHCDPVFGEPDVVPAAHNQGVGGMNHWAVPTRQEALERLTQELCMIAETVPLYAPPTVPLPPQFESAPTPRPVPAIDPIARDDWDFLKPGYRARPVEQPSAAKPAPVAPNPTPKQKIANPSPYLTLVK